MRTDRYSQEQILRDAAAQHQEASALYYAQLRDFELEFGFHGIANTAACFAATGRAILFQLIENSK